MVEWLELHDCDQHGLDSKPAYAILLCPWKRHLTTLFPAWQSWEAILILVIKINNKNKKFQAESNILASPKVGWGNFLPYLLAFLLLSCKSGG